MGLNVMHVIVASVRLRRMGLIGINLGEIAFAWG
jgi:hypothetical protein